MTTRRADTRGFAGRARTRADHWRAARGGRGPNGPSCDPLPLGFRFSPSWAPMIGGNASGRLGAIPRFVKGFPSSRFGTPTGASAACAVHVPRWRSSRPCQNHYHLILETPRANLSVAMRHLNGVYAQSFNRRHRRALCGESCRCRLYRRRRRPRPRHQSLDLAVLPSWGQVLH